MQYYIPKRLENFKLIQNFKKLIALYNKQQEEKEYIKGSFYDYDQLNSLDAVKRFLEYMLYNKSFGDDTMTEDEKKELKDSIINYYTSRLYSYRGTMKIISILREIEDILGIKFGDIRYETSKLDISIESIETSNITYFFNSLLDFMENLLYFKELNDEVDNVKVPIDIYSKPNIKMNSHFQSEYTVEEEVG